MLIEHPEKWMVWEADPDQAKVIKLKSKKVKSLVFDPCGNAPNQNDSLTVMGQNIRNLKSALQ